MTKSIPHPINPELDLVLERVVDVSRELVWMAWTNPEHLKKWFTPAPWRTVECEIDLRPGGIFRTVMLSPEGQRSESIGCYLEVTPNQKLVWTSVLEPGYRPTRHVAEKECDEIPFTGIILLEPEGRGTKYTAIAVHAREADARRHSEMGFHEGWGAALDQLVASVKAL